MPQRKTKAKRAKAAEQVVTDKPKPSLKQRILKAVPFMLLAMLLTFVFYRTGTYRGLETALLDSYMRLDMPTAESKVVIVDITQADFENEKLFNRQSRPLNPEALHRLITEIARAKPCVIGVDIDTHFAEFGKFKVDESWSPSIVWAREPKTIPEEANQKLTLDNALGRENLPDKHTSGVPLLIDDAADKVTRRYVREVEIEREGTFPSFPSAVYNASRKNCAGIPPPKIQAKTEPLLISFSRSSEGIGRKRLPASFFMNEGDEQTKNDLLRDKIVLIGGSYLGEDKHDTPLGVMDGLEIMANVVETELKGGGFKPLNSFIVVLLIIFDGVVLVLLFHLLPFDQAIWVSILAIPALALICSLAAYWSLAYWAYFVPIMLFVLGNELWDAAKNYFKRETAEAYKTASDENQEEQPKKRS